jgi:VWFA-related protein
MNLKMGGFWSAAWLVLVGATLCAQTPAPAQPAPAQEEQPTFRIQVDLVTTDVIPRDERGNFIADLTRDEFEVYEDGVKQELVSFVLTHGGRVYTQLSAPPPPVQEGIILPPTRPPSDAAGRIFLIFVDDLHLDFRNSPRVRDLFTKIKKELIHEGDLFGIVSSGPSAIEIDLTYDRRRLDEAMKKIMGSALRPTELIEAPEGAQGPPELRHRAHVAFSTAYDIMKNLEQVQNRRKAFIYISSGYDFNPFPKGRAEYRNQLYGINPDSNAGGGDSSGYVDPMVDPFTRQTNTFAESDLVIELAELTRAANRANATIHTIDPRGLIGGPDIDEQVDITDWNSHIRTTQDTLRVLAELTGGIAVVNQNDFDKALKKIDGEMSDYYVLGYYSSNPDPLKRRRVIEVKVKRPDLQIQHRREYSLRPLPAQAIPK